MNKKYLSSFPCNILSVELENGFAMQKFNVEYNIFLGMMLQIFWQLSKQGGMK